MSANALTRSHSRYVAAALPRASDRPMGPFTRFELLGSCALCSRAGYAPRRKKGGSRRGISECGLAVTRVGRVAGAASLSRGGRRRTLLLSRCQHRAANQAVRCSTRKRRLRTGRRRGVGARCRAALARGSPPPLSLPLLSVDWWRAGDLVRCRMRVPIAESSASLSLRISDACSNVQVTSYKLQVTSATL